MSILISGQTVTIPVDVKVLAPFAYNDRVYYISKPVNAYADTIWLISSDGEPLVPTPDLLARAGAALAKIER